MEYKHDDPKTDQEIDLLIAEYMDHTIEASKYTDEHKYLRATLGAAGLRKAIKDGWALQFHYKRDANMLFNVIDRLRHDGASVIVSIGITYLCEISVTAPQWGINVTQMSKTSVERAMYYAIGIVLERYKSKQ